MDHGALRIHDPEVDDCIHLHGDVVARDDVLARHVLDERAQVRTHDLLNDRDHDDETGPRDPRETAQCEENTALIFPEDPDRRCKDRCEDNEKERVG